MPAESCAQLRKAYVEAEKGESWAKELIESTSDEFKANCARAQRNRKRRFSTKKEGD